ncbi:MAG: hypothetical protein H6662_08870 [Ardenticatenaceae bacterium]|nr:hypothetical protein [Ardenticatenaceae bacterium]MCB9003287.1 hypothetical protein [Ardenticatenaceae bacterium]
MRLQITALTMIVSLIGLTSCALGFSETLPTPAANPTPLPTATEYIEECGDSGVTALVWEDADGNGKNNNETPLSDICMNANYYKPGSICDGTTNNEGFWTSTLMVGGCGTEEELNALTIEQCKSIYMTVLPSEEYVVTTQATVIGCNARFGLQHVVTDTLPATAPN